MGEGGGKWGRRKEKVWEAKGRGERGKGERHKDGGVEARREGGGRGGDILKAFNGEDIMGCGKEG